MFVWAARLTTRRMDVAPGTVIDEQSNHETAVVCGDGVLLRMVDVEGVPLTSGLLLGRQVPEPRT